jgi:hypothetical protein
VCSYLADQQNPVDDDLVLWKDGNRSHPQYGCQLTMAEARAEGRLRMQAVLRSCLVLVQLFAGQNQRENAEVSDME